MATQSHMEKEQKPEQKPDQKLQRNEVLIGLKNQATLASGDESCTSYHEPASEVPAVSSDMSPSGSSALSSSPAGSTAATAATFSTNEELGLVSTACVEMKRCSDLQGSRSPHAELRCVVSETSGLATVGPPLKGTDQPRGHLAQMKSQRNNRGRKQSSPDQDIWVRKLPGRRRLLPETLRPQRSEVSPSTSSSSQPSGSRHSQASTCTLASRSGPALRSHASGPSPALRRRSYTALPVPALHRPACGPGPAIYRRRATPPGSVPHRLSHALPPAERRRAPAPGPPAKRRRAPAPGPAERRRAPAPGPAERRGATPSGPAYRSRASRPSSARQRRGTPTGPAFRGGTARSGPSSPSTNAMPDPILSKQSPTRLSCHTLPGPADGNPPSPPGFALQSLVFKSSSDSSDSEVESVSSQHSWHAVRMRASSPSPPGRFFPLPAQCNESSPSSPSHSPFHSRSPGLSPSSFSSSSPKFLGLRSISTPSPDSLRRALMPEFEALNPPPGEQVGIESTPHPPTPPVL
uniref:EZH inhibitory protein n=1 Tax=Otolemur garnettii TaxID=30611 RepID=H0XMB1_OTOGA